MALDGEPAAPLVTVVVATFDSRVTLGCALASVQRQTFQDFEVWVVGDACRDGSEAVVAALADARFQWLNLPRNTGSQAGPNDEGARRARGRLLAYLGHDDLWFPWHLETLVEAMAREGAAFAHGLGAILGPGDDVQVSGPPLQGRSYDGHFVPPTNWLVERALIDRIGGWGDPGSLPRPVDVDVIRRLAASGARMIGVTRLTTLKFPSPLWRAYAADAARPQVALAEAMAADPEALRDRTLTGIAAAYSGTASVVSPRPVAMAWGEVVGALRRAVGASLRAIDEWPLVAPILRWRHQRLRRRQRARRGLR